MILSLKGYINEKSELSDLLQYITILITSYITENCVLLFIADTLDDFEHHRILLTLPRDTFFNFSSRFCIHFLNLKQDRSIPSEHTPKTTNSFPLSLACLLELYVTSISTTAYFVLLTVHMHKHR